MVMPKDERFPQIQQNVVQSWRTHMTNMENSLDMLEQEIDEAAQMSSTCTSEWCEATEHVIDELGNSLFSISEPRWSSEEDSEKLKALKRRVHELYAKYKTTTAST